MQAVETQVSFQSFRSRPLYPVARAALTKVTKMLANIQEIASCIRALTYILDQSAD